MSYARLRFNTHVQGHYQESKVSLRGLQGHLIHTVTFLVSAICSKGDNFYGSLFASVDNKFLNCSLLLREEVIFKGANS